MSKLTNLNGWIFEQDEPSLKEFHNMTQEQKNEYIGKIIDKPEDQRSTIQKHIIKFYNILPVKRKNFYTLDIEG